MIFTAVSFAAILATLNSGVMAASPTSCLFPLAAVVSSGCDSAISAECSSGESLFDVLDPATVCTAQNTAETALCQDILVPAFDDAEELGVCCTYDTVYETAGDTGCGSDYLSFGGLSAAIQYFCSKTTVDSNPDYYCFSDAVDYAQSTGAQVTTAATYLLGGDVPNAQAAFEGFDCAKVVESQCCYPSVEEFGTYCGGSTAETQVDQIASWQTAVSLLCDTFGGESVPTFGNICTGLPELSNATCYAADDAACDGIPAPEFDDDDDDAAAALMPTLASLFAAIFAVAFFSRRF